MYSGINGGPDEEGRDSHDQVIIGNYITRRTIQTISKVIGGSKRGRKPKKLNGVEKKHLDKKGYRTKGNSQAKIDLLSESNKDDKAERKYKKAAKVVTAADVLRENLIEGSGILVKDRYNIWCEAFVIKLDQQRVCISYSTEKLYRNEWIRLDSDRIKLINPSNDSDNTPDFLNPYLNQGTESGGSSFKKSDKSLYKSHQGDSNYDTEYDSNIGKGCNLSKKKLGRPRKYPLPLPESESGSTGNYQSKKKLGRPRKYPELYIEEDKLKCDKLKCDKRKLSSLSKNAKDSTIVQLNKKLEQKITPSPIIKRQYDGVQASSRTIQNSDGWTLYCDQCSVFLEQYRYYCLDCETDATSKDSNGFDLCADCYQNRFPKDHQHHRLCFGMEWLVNESNIEDYSLDKVGGEYNIYPIHSISDLDGNSKSTQLILSFDLDITFDLNSTCPFKATHRVEISHDNDGNFNSLDQINDYSTSKAIKRKKQMKSMTPSYSGVYRHFPTLTRVTKIPTITCIFCHDSVDQNTKDISGSIISGDFISLTQPFILKPTPMTMKKLSNRIINKEIDLEVLDYYLGPEWTKEIADISKIKRGRPIKRKVPSDAKICSNFYIDLYWAHINCARSSNQVLMLKNKTKKFLSSSNDEQDFSNNVTASSEFNFYNLSRSVRSSQSHKCSKCRERGASVGCVKVDCPKYYHLKCTNKPMDYFENKVVFYCPYHEKSYVEKEKYDESFRCDSCQRALPLTNKDLEIPIEDFLISNKGTPLIVDGSSEKGSILEVDSPSVLSELSSLIELSNDLASSLSDSSDLSSLTSLSTVSSTTDLHNQVSPTDVGMSDHENLPDIDLSLSTNNVTLEPLKVEDNLNHDEKLSIPPYFSEEDKCEVKLEVANEGFLNTMNNLANTLENSFLEGKVLEKNSSNPLIDSKDDTIKSTLNQTNSPSKSNKITIEQDNSALTMKQLSSFVSQKPSKNFNEVINMTSSNLSETLPHNIVNNKDFTIDSQRIVELNTNSKSSSQPIFSSALINAENLQTKIASFSSSQKPEFSSHLPHASISSLDNKVILTSPKDSLNFSDPLAGKTSPNDIHPNLKPHFSSPLPSKSAIEVNGVDSPLLNVDSNLIDLSNDQADQILREDSIEVHSPGPSRSLTSFWFTCQECLNQNSFSPFDLCPVCFEHHFQHTCHHHPKSEFVATDQGGMLISSMKKNAMLIPQKKIKKSKPSREYNLKFKGKAKIECSYCWTTTSKVWRKGFSGVLLCAKCFEDCGNNNSKGKEGQTIHNRIKRWVGTKRLKKAKLQKDDTKEVDVNLNCVLPIKTPDIDIMSLNVDEGLTPKLQFNPIDQYNTNIEDYSHKPYDTRIKLGEDIFDDCTGKAKILESYEPNENYWYSLVLKTTYLDIPGRAPRWASHSGSDYHGTWLAQTVRRSLQRFTKPGALILSNFLGRGTDAIECFLNGRKCIGIDINPVAVSLSQQNCTFSLPYNSKIDPLNRPIILQGDSRDLSGIPMFKPEIIDHILSHPPYKDCVKYSNHIRGDLSRIPDATEFQLEMSKVAKESWRLLKDGGRVTLGIGDNRERCFYIPVGFQLIRTYMNNGFELEELVIKRQRQCQMYGLGTFLSAQYDFLIFTHEYIAILKKIKKAPSARISKILFTPEQIQIKNGQVDIKRTVRAVPIYPITRKEVIMGTVWTFKPTLDYPFEILTKSRMVERFSLDKTNWEDVELKFPNSEETKSDMKPPPDGIDDGDGDDEATDYERLRQQKIKANTQILLSLGLTAELGDEKSEDILHYNNLMSISFNPSLPLGLVLSSHHPNHHLSRVNIPIYRKALQDVAKNAAQRLCLNGVLVIGVQDYRLDKDHFSSFIPLPMLVYEDIKRVVPEDVLRLKEVVMCVPEGYKCHPEDQYDEMPEEVSIVRVKRKEIDHLPIIQACYLVYTKVGHCNQR